MREAILRVDRRGLLWTISRMLPLVLIVRTTSLSDRTPTLGRQPVSRNVSLIRVKTPLDGILRSGKRLYKIHTQNACHNIPRGKTQKAFLQLPCKQLTVTQARLTLHSTLKEISAIAWHTSCAGCSIWNRKKPPHFSGHYLRKHSTLDVGVLGYVGIL